MEAAFGILREGFFPFTVTFTGEAFWLCHKTMPNWAEGERGGGSRGGEVGYFSRVAPSKKFSFHVRRRRRRPVT